VLSLGVVIVLKGETPWDGQGHVERGNFDEWDDPWGDVFARGRSKVHVVGYSTARYAVCGVRTRNTLKTPGSREQEKPSR